MIFIGVVDALPHLLEIEAAAANDESTSIAKNRRSAGNGAHNSATMLLLRMCGGGSQEAVDALLRTVRKTSAHYDQRIIIRSLCHALLRAVAYLSVLKPLWTDGIDHFERTLLLMVLGSHKTVGWNRHCADRATCPSCLRWYVYVPFLGLDCCIDATVGKGTVPCGRTTFTNTSGMQRARISYVPRWYRRTLHGCVGTVEIRRNGGVRCRPAAQLASRTVCLHCAAPGAISMFLTIRRIYRD